MKRCEAITIFARLRKFGINLFTGACLFLVLLFLGCAAPKPIIIKHQVNSGPKIVVSSDQKGNGDIADLLNILRNKNVINEEEAKQFAEKYGITLPAVQSGTTTVQKNVSKQAESTTGKAADSPHSVPEQDVQRIKEKSDVETKKNGDEQKEKVQAIADDEKKKDISEPESKEDKNDISSGNGKDNGDQSEKTLTAVDDEKKKDIPEPESKEDKTDISSGNEKDNGNQSEKPLTTVDEAIKKDSPEPENKEKHNDVSSVDSKNDIYASGVVGEEMKKDIQEEVKNQVQEEVAKEIKKLDFASSLPEWIKRIRFGGDLRLRYEHDQFDQNNGIYANPSTWQQMNTTASHDYFRYRVRVGMDVPVNDKMEAVIRLATGNDSNPVSTNSTMGDYMNEDKVYFDLAYLKWQPWKFLTFEGGRMPNPWFYSDLVWSPNLNFEGLILGLNNPITDLWTTFLTVGVFPLQQNDFFERSKYLAAGQLVLERKQQKGISAKIGTAYYDFNNITGEVNTTAYPNLNDWTAPLYQQKGNTLFNIAVSGTKTALASEFRELNFTANLDIGLWDPVHIVFLGDYVRNLGFDMADVVQRTTFPNAGDIDGYQVGMSVGHPMIQDFGQWKIYLYYKFLGADAVVDAYTDTDFHLGGTDAKGWIFGADLGLAKNTWLSARWLTANEIHGNQGDTFGIPLAIDVLQVDLNIRF
jgi:hypothetical protein